MAKNATESLVKSFISSLPDEELSALHSLAWQETERRVKDKVARGEYNPLDWAEATLIAQGEWVSAIQHYYKRMKCSLLLARHVVEANRPALDNCAAFNS